MCSAPISSAPARSAIVRATFRMRVYARLESFIRSLDRSSSSRAPGTKIVAFTRYKMGDGLEKKVSDLAAEVAEQIAKK